MADIKPLPIWLQRTEAQKASDEQVQEVLRATHGRVKPTDEERMITRGYQMAEIGRVNYETAIADINALITKSVEDGQVAVPDEATELVSRLRIAQATLAEGMAGMGQFAEASELHPDPNKQIEYRAIHEALERDDNEVCECAPDRAEVYTDAEGEQKTSRLKKNEAASRKGVVIETSPFYIERKVYSLKHKRIVGVERCQKCGHRNAKPVEGKLKVRESLRKESHAAGQSVHSDIQVLKV